MIHPTFSEGHQQQYSIARTAWKTLEPYHAMIYFALEARTAYTEAGLKGFWIGYFASRVAAMGAVSASVVAATFFNFHPNMVARAIPSAWHLSNPEGVLAARLHAADAAAWRILEIVELKLLQVLEEIGPQLILDLA
jgi:hypothetical protein